MKKRNLALAGLLSGSLLYFGNGYISSASGDEGEKMDRFFESGIYEKAERQYGVSGMGVGKSERILTVQVRENDTELQDKVKQHFEKQLADKGLSQYEVEIVLLEK